MLNTGDRSTAISGGDPSTLYHEALSLIFSMQKYLAKISGGLEDRLLPGLLQLLCHIVSSGIRHLGVLHGGLYVRVADPVLDSFHAKSLGQQMRRAAVLEDMEMPKFLRN